MAAAESVGMAERTHNAANATEAVDADLRNHFDGAEKMSAVPAEVLARGEEHAPREEGRGSMGQAHNVSWEINAVERAVTESQEEETVGRKGMWMSL